MRYVLIALMLAGCASTQTVPTKPQTHEAMYWVRPGTTHVDEYMNEFITDALYCARETQRYDGWERRLRTQECMERAGYVQR
jgi:hypothetical protein